MEITKEFVERLHRVLDCGLTVGKGTANPGEFCVEAAVCYAMGLPHSDEPECVGSMVRLAKITLNDAAWLSNKSRAEGLRKLAIAQLGSNEIDQFEFNDRLRLENIKQILPDVLRQLNLTDIASVCEVALSKDNIIPYLASVTNSVYSIIWCDDSIFNCKGDRKIFYNGYRAIEYALQSMHENESSISWAAKSAIWSSRIGDNPEPILNKLADIMLQILKDMGSPGCQFLEE